MQSFTVHVRTKLSVRVNVYYCKLAKWPHPGSTKQRIVSQSDDREDADSVLDCTMSLDVDGDSGDSDSVM